MPKELLTGLVIVSQFHLRAMSITNPTNYEEPLVIRFFTAKSIDPVRIHSQLVEVYGEGVMIEWNMLVICLMGKDQMCTM
jgi:hypothetical protein